MDRLADRRTRGRISKRVLGWLNDYGATEVLGIVAATVKQNAVGHRAAPGREGEWEFVADELTRLFKILERGPASSGVSRSAVLELEPVPPAAESRKPMAAAAASVPREISRTARTA